MLNLQSPKMEGVKFLDVLLLALIATGSIEVSGGKLEQISNPVLSDGAKGILRLNITRQAASRIYDEDTCGGDISFGVCVNTTECNARGGSNSGNCWGEDVCCKITARCASPTNPCIIRHSGTTVVNENSTADYRRTYRFMKSVNVCQLRLDFDQFDLAQPDSNGDCSDDVMQATASGTRISLCGENHRQHVYLDFDSRSYVDVSMRIRDRNSKYRIRATFIECTSESRAPENCLQYFNYIDDTVKSFNFGHRQLNNHEYSICVDRLDDSNKIQWRPCRNVPNAFFISGVGATSGLTTSLNCPKDYVQIYGLDRYCGNGFASVTSTAKPFLMNVRFDQAEGFGVTLPTDPSECTGQVIQDPYTGGFITCPVPLPGETTCTCELTVPEIDLPVGQIPYVPDLDNTGFCLEYLQTS